MKIAIELDTIAPIPTATATTSRYSPAALPATVASPAVRPDVSDRLTTNSTLGPGITISTNDGQAERQQMIAGNHPGTLSSRSQPANSTEYEGIFTSC